MDTSRGQMFDPVPGSSLVLHHGFYPNFGLQLWEDRGEGVVWRRGSYN